MEWLVESVSDRSGDGGSEGVLFSLLEEVLTKVANSEGEAMPPPLAEQLAETVLFLCAKIAEHSDVVRLTKFQVLIPLVCSGVAGRVVASNVLPCVGRVVVLAGPHRRPHDCPASQQALQRSGVRPGCWLYAKRARTAVHVTGSPVQRE